MKMKKALSALTALTMAASAFSAFVVPASAADATEVTATFVGSANLLRYQGYTENGTTVDVADQAVTNYSNANYSTMIVGSQGNYNANMLMKYSNYEIPSDMKLDSATLSYTISSMSNTNGTSAITLAYPTVVGAWDPTTVTWRTIFNEATVTTATTTALSNFDEDSPITAYNDIATSDIAKAATNVTYDIDVTSYISAQEETGADYDFVLYNCSRGANINSQPVLTLSLISADTATYSVTTNYVDENGVSLAESLLTADVAEGTVFTPTYETEFNSNGYKYTYASGGDAVTITGDTVINIVYSSRELAETTYTLKAVYGEAEETLATDTITEDSTVTIAYPKYVINDDVLYTIAAQALTSGKYHAVDITGTQTDQEITATYTADTSVTPVYYAEMEDVLTNNGVSNALIRCSNGAGGDIDDSQTIVTLSAGTYLVSTAVWGGGKTDESQSTYVITAGENTAATATTTGSLTAGTSTEFTLTEDTDLVLTKTVTGTSSACVDYILITGTGTATEPVAEPVEYVLDLSSLTAGEITPKLNVDVVASDYNTGVYPVSADNSGDTPGDAVTEDDAVQCDVADFGTGTSYVAAISALDGWGYNHFSYTSFTKNGYNTQASGRQTSVSITEDGGLLFAGIGNTPGVGIGYLTFTPENADITMPTSGTIYYSFTATTVSTSKDASLPIGFNSSTAGNDVSSVASYSLTGSTEGEQDYAVYMTYDLDTKDYTIMVDDETVAEGTATEDVTGIYAQTHQGRYGNITISDFAMGEVTEAEPTPTPTVTPADEPTATPTATPADEPTATPTAEPTTAPTAEPGTVLYEQDYDDATEVDWVSPNYQDMFSLVEDADGGQMLQADHSVSSPNSRGAYLLFGDLEAGSQYVLEFDLGLEAGTNHNQDSYFAVMGADYSYSINDGINSGYPIKLTAAVSASTIAIEGSSATVPYDGTMYHYSVIVDGTVAYLTVTSGDDTIVEQQTIPVNGDGGLAGFYYRSGRNTGIMQIDNIVLRTPYEGEVPENKTHTVTVNTTRYATIELTSGETYYADVNGLISIPLIADGTIIEYTLSKVGYTSVSGSVTVDDDKTINQMLVLDDDHSDYIYFESDFGNEDGAYASASASRGDSITLGTIELPELSEISASFTFEGFGTYAGQQKTWAIVTDAGKLVGIQMTDDGLVAWTGWTGTDAMNQYSDLGAYSNSAVLASEFPTGAFTVGFVVDTENKAITVSYGDVSASLTYDIDATTITGLATGLYRYYGALNTTEFSVAEPDASYMVLAGDTKFAVIPGKTVEREYTKTEGVITPGETFTWTVTDADGAAVAGVTAADGVVYVEDTTVAGTYTLTATGSTGKSASLTIEITDPATIASYEIDYPLAMMAGQTGDVTVTNVIDSCGDNVTAYLFPTYESLTEDVLTVDEEGVITALANGTGLIQVTIGNAGLESVMTYEITVDDYYVIESADGDSTTVDVSGIYDKASSFLVTTTKDGEIVSQTTVSADDFVKTDESTVTKLVLAKAGKKYTVTYGSLGILASVTIEDVAEGYELNEEIPIGSGVFYWDDNMTPIEQVEKTETVYGTITYTADTTGADTVEIAPIYETTVGELLEIPSGTYDITATVGNTRRADLYVNDQMIFNNLNQGSDSWTVARTVRDSQDYEAGDVVIGQGYAKFNLQDDQSSGTAVTAVKLVKAPAMVDRAQRIYVIGDSLVAKYYGDAPAGEENLVRTGWGDVLENYISDDVAVTNLGNSGAWATGMLADAFTSVEASAQKGDIVIWESGYNDKNYSTTEDMEAAITAAAAVCYSRGIDFYLVTPNASRHDYSDSVVWSSYIREIAENSDIITLIDLCQESFELLSGLYGTDATEANDVLVTYYNNSGDTLHSSYNAANLWAAIVAQGLYDAGETDVVDTTYYHTFNDGTQDVTAQVKAN